MSCKSTSSQSFTQFEHNSNNNKMPSSSSSSSSTSSPPPPTTTSTVTASLANKKYNVYSRKSDLIHDKLHQTILMLAIGGEKATAAAHSRQLKKSASSRMSMSSLNDDSELLGGVLGDYASQSVTNSSSSSCNIDMQIRQVQMSREVFHDYCDQFKTFRKLIMPIKSFHDDE